MDHEYAAISGIPEFTKAATKLLLGENHPFIKENKVRRLFPRSSDRLVDKLFLAMTARSNW